MNKENNKKHHERKFVNISFESKIISHLLHKRL